MRHQTCKNGRTDRAVVWGGDWGRSEELCIRWAWRRAHWRHLANTVEVHGGYEWVCHQVEGRRGLFPNYFGQSCHYYYDCTLEMEIESSLHWFGSVRVRFGFHLYFARTLVVVVEEAEEVVGGDPREDALLLAGQDA